MQPSPAFINDTIKTFSPCYGREITVDEAEEIIQNFGRMLEIVGKVKKQNLVVRGGDEDV